MTRVRSRLVREHLQIEHQLGVRLVRGRERPPAASTSGSSRLLCSRPSGCGARRRALPRGTRRSCAVARAEAALESVTDSTSESRMLRSVLRSRQARPDSVLPPSPNKPLEHDARVVLHRQRRGRPAPGERAARRRRWYPASQTPVSSRRSRPSSSEASCVSLGELPGERSGPSRCRAMIRPRCARRASCPSGTSADARRRGCVPLRRVQARQHEHLVAVRRERLRIGVISKPGRPPSGGQTAPSPCRSARRRAEAADRRGAASAGASQGAATIPSQQRERHRLGRRRPAQGRVRAGASELPPASSKSS